MIQFEVGKSYKYGNTIYTVAKRSAVFISFTDQNGNKFRAKPKPGIRAEYEEVYIKFCQLDAKHDLVCSQPEITTAEITPECDNDNATASQPAIVATAQSDTTDSPKSLLDADYFKGKSIDEIKQIFSRASLKQLKGFALCYTIPYFNRMNKCELIDALASKISLILEERYGYMTAENVTGDNGYAQQDDIIIPAPKPRTIPQPVSVNFIPGTVYYGNDSGNHFTVKITARTAEYVTTDFIGALIKEAKIQTIAGVEYAVFPTQYRNIEIWADKPEPIEHEERKTTAQPEIVKFVVGKTYQNDSPDFCYGAYYTITGKSRQFVSFESYFLRKQAYKKLRIGTDRNGVLCEYFDDKEKGSPYPAQMVYATALAPDIPNNTDSSASVETVQTESAPAIIYGMCDVEKALRRIKSKSKHTPADFTQPDALYMDDSYSDAPGDNSYPDMDIPHDRTPDEFPAKNPGFTVVPSELITPPDYTVYPESFTDECPYTTVYACDIPTLTHAAVVPYAEAAPIRKIYRIIAILIRLWIGLHSAPSLKPLYDFPDGLFTHYPTRKYPRKIFRRAVFEVGSSYTASCYSSSNGLQSFTFLVTGRVVYEATDDKRKGVFLFVTCNSPDNHDFEGRGIVRVHNDHGVEVYNHHKGYEMGCGWQVFSFRADKRDNIPYPFKDTTPSDPNYMPCGYCTRFISREFLHYSDNPDSIQPVHSEINDITREPETTPKTRKQDSAPDIEHKLIETKDLHFQERRAALDHNAAVISSCMFSEAVVSMLLKISPAAIFQLGFHMGLFIAKPKGKKIAIAEAFAKRLINRRDLHSVKSASVHTRTAQQTSNNTASIPDNVKFFETKHGQLAFVFTDELVFTD